MWEYSPGSIPCLLDVSVWLHFQGLPAVVLPKVGSQPEDGGGGEGFAAVAAEDAGVANPGCQARRGQLGEEEPESAIKL